MKKLLLSIFCLFQANAQQNLVLNPSFEDVGTDFVCNSFNVQFPNLFAQNWRTTNSASPDILHSNYPGWCFLNTLGSWSNQLPHSGNGYAGLANHYLPSTFFREYLRGKLSQPLQVGQTYVINFYACLGIYSSDGSNNLGVKFIEGAIEPEFYPNMLLPFQPDVNYSGSPLTVFDNWTLFSFYFTPTLPNLDEFIIGNFFDDENTLRQNLQSGYTANTTYFLIDDVEVFAVSVDFDEFEPICKGDSLILPSVSNNNVTGTWSPAPNNQETTTYTFTPDNPIYPTYEITIVVKPVVIPEFDEIEPFCDEFPEFTDLPTTSNNGVEGTWNPTFNPTQTETYTFTPNDTECIEIITKTIVIETISIFDGIGPFCEPDLNFSLPTVSTNGISGTWSPDFDPYNSQTYTFTRDFGDCTQKVSLNIIVSEDFEFDLIHYCEESQYNVEVKFKNFINQDNYKYVWKINGTEVINNNSKLILSKHANLLQNINIIEVLVTDVNGCFKSNQVEVLGKDFCKIQKGISPNGDGLNEYFDLVSFGGVDLKIFNRYGSVVYEKSNYKNEWKGQSKSGKNLPSGTYFYQIQTNIGEQFTGYIQLTY